MTCEEDVATVNRRILIVDDNADIHEDFRKILTPPACEGDRALDELESAFLGTASERVDSISFQLDSALQGQEALEKVVQAVAADAPYAVAFVDMRMPPGWDGLETIEHLWSADQDLQIVICTAYSDRSWDDISRRIGPSDRLLILKKPFDSIEVKQLAHALTEKWALAKQARRTVEGLEKSVEEKAEEVRTLQALIPICSWCKKVRDDAGYWDQLDLFLRERDLALFTDGICPECSRKLLDQMTDPPE